MRPGGWYRMQSTLTDRVKLSYVHFDLQDSLGKSLYSDRILPPEIQDLADLPHVDSTLQRIVDLLHLPVAAKSKARRIAQETAALLFEALLRDIDFHAVPKEVALHGTPEHHRQVVLESVSHISQSSEEMLSITDLARRAGYSGDHFGRVFRNIMGSSPQDYVIESRLKQACHLLRNTALSISQIADQLGYNNVFFFSTQFRKKIGKTPTQYRNSKGR